MLFCEDAQNGEQNGRRQEQVRRNGRKLKGDHSDEKGGKTAEKILKHKKKRGNL